MTDHIKHLILTSERLSAESSQLNAEISLLTAEFIRLKNIGNELRELSYSLTTDRKHLSGSIAKVLSQSDQHTLID
jgi:hypothetical protein